jgi:hypothetical protein
MKRNIGQEILEGVAAIKGGGGVQLTYWQMRTTHLVEILERIKNKRIAGFWKFNKRTGEENEPIEQRELTQQEVAKWCEIAPATVNKWASDGLKFVQHGKRRFYMVKDIEEFIKGMIANA